MSKLAIRALKKLGLLEFLNLHVKVTVNNQKFNIPVIKGIGLTNVYGTEPWMIQLFTELFKLKRDGAYYDVGVNLGQTLIKLKSVNADVEYFGFEPNPICVFYSKELIKLNGYNNATLFPVGISNEDSIYSLSLFSDNDADSAASMLENFRPQEKIFRREFIPCFNIDKISEKYKMPKIGILKIDVEGAEKEVLESFEKRIRHDRPLIQVEILPVYNEEHTERLMRQNSIETLLRSLDYSILRVRKTDQDHFGGFEEIETIGIHSNMDWCEYLLVPGSEKMKFIQLNSTLAGKKPGIR